MSKIVFISPHFDDETLAAGATLAKLCERGHEVFVVALTDSEEGYAEKFDAKEKRKQGIASCKSLGLKEENVYSKARLFDEILYASQPKNFVNWEDIRSDTKEWERLYDMRMEENGSTVVQTVMKVVRFFKPDIVLSTSADFHTDHRACAKYVKEGVYQAARCGISGSVESFKEPLVLLGSVDMERPFLSVPHIYSEVTKEQLEKKIEALQCYPDFMSEHESNAKSIFSSDMGRDWTWSTARLNGMRSESKTGLAEAFVVDSLKLMISLDTLLEHII
jgi:LmbE family N-acetylglucosaminyl deacetylase